MFLLESIDYFLSDLKLNKQYLYLLCMGRSKCSIKLFYYYYYYCYDYINNAIIIKKKKKNSNNNIQKCSIVLRDVMLRYKNIAVCRLHLLFTCYSFWHS